MNAYPTLTWVALLSLSTLGWLSTHSLAVVGKVNPQVHEVVLSPTRFIDNPFEHRLVNLIRNIPKHDLGNHLDMRRCACIGCRYLPLFAHQSLPEFGGYRHGCDALVSHDMVPYLPERLLGAESPTHCDPMRSYFCLGCP